MYTSKDILRIAKRNHNTKRQYLLVNPLQGKHIPVKPSDCLNMLHYFGKKLYTKYPETKLIIGFAETATAVGAGISSMFSDCVYMHTTRESTNSDCIQFLEEHSHAAEQILITDNFKKYLNNTDTVIFIDDELSTGKTMRNIVKQIIEVYPEFKTKKIVVASLLNTMSNENLKLMEDNNIACEWLVKLPATDYTSVVNKMPEIKSAETITANNNQAHIRTYLFNDNTQLDFVEPRIGVNINKYNNYLKAIINDLYIANQFDVKDNVLILGTEECMYPALIIGEYLEQNGKNVLMHATTRSPIGILNEFEYPVKNGYTLSSFYDENRTTFIYNIKKYNNATAIIVFDSKARQTCEIAMNNMVDILTKYEIDDIIFMEV